MCGIVAAVARRNVVPVLLEGLKRLEYRGYDSAGVARAGCRLSCTRSRCSFSPTMPRSTRAPMSTSSGAISRLKQ
ncbi:MAG: hypothetical protein E6H41_13235 [Betaproteobacteria bacterium]|nr:MAG: hypothetical protein E6H41_13235 [Betaproteobacteria bacterium]